MAGIHTVTAKQPAARRRCGCKRTLSRLARRRHNLCWEAVAPPHHIDVTGGKTPNVQG